MKMVIALLLSLPILVACNNNKEFTKLSSKYEYVILTKYNAMNGDLTSIVLNNKESKNMLKEINQASKHILDSTGKKSCGNISTVVYFINIKPRDSNIRTFSNTGGCGNIYDEKDELALNTSLSKQLDEFFD